MRTACLAAVLGAYSAWAFNVPRIQIRQARSPSRLHSTIASSTSTLYPPPVTGEVIHERFPEPAPHSDAVDERGSFDWYKQWYPIRVQAYTDKGRPHSIQLLGKDFVLWYDTKNESWSALDDACPHRLAPLSEGRVEPDGTLLCAYHAWRFAGDGACVSIPQSTQEQAAKHMAQPKACAKSFPVQVRDGMIFMWPESGLEALAESSRKQPSLVPELSDQSLIDAKRIINLPLNTRDLPYGWEAFHENIADPSHVVVSHHNIIGNRYTDAKPVTITNVNTLTAERGFRSEVRTVQSPPGSRTFMDWKPPAHLQIRTEYDSGATSVLSLYASPSVPGRCLHIGQQVLIKDPKGKAPPGLGFFALPLPVWLQHALASVFLHQDMVFLHGQQLLLETNGVDPANFHERIYSPNGQDQAVLRFKTWIAKFAGGGPAWAEGTDTRMPRLSNDELFDVYHTHTKECTVCSKALKNFTRAQKVLRAGALLTVISALSAGTAYVPAAIAAGLFYGGSVGVKKFSGMYTKYEFSHQNND